MTGATAMHAAALGVEEYVCAETIRRIAVVPQTLSNWWRRPPWPLRAEFQRFRGPARSNWCGAATG
jgi:hypothetical protein